PFRCYPHPSSPRPPVKTLQREMVPDPFPPSDENGESVKRYQWVVVRFASTLRRPSQSPRRPRAGIHTAAPVPRLRLPKPTYSVSTHLCLHPPAIPQALQPVQRITRCLEDHGAGVSTVLRP